MAGMAGTFGIPYGKGGSPASDKARKVAMARLDALKKREMDTPTRIFGEAAKAVLPDVGVLNRAVRDPIGTAKGVAEVASLASPVANAYRAYKLATGDGFSVTGADMQDVEQALEVAGLIPTGKAATLPAKFGVSLFDQGIRGAARRTTPSMLSAASGGIISGGPKALARSAGSKPVADAPRSSLLPSGAPRYAGSAKQEVDRTVKTALQEVEDLQSQLDEAMRGDAVDTNYVSQLMSDMREVRSTIANDVVLNRGGQRPYGLNRDQEVALGLIDDAGYPVYNITDMSREEVGSAFKRTLEEGKKRQELLLNEGKIDKVDDLPDWDDPEYVAYVDDYYNNAVAIGNAVRTTGAEGQAVNWGSLANDHAKALAAGGSNTYKNLIDTFGRANSQKGKG